MTQGTHVYNSHWLRILRSCSGVADSFTGSLSLIVSRSRISCSIAMPVLVFFSTIGLYWRRSYPNSHIPSQVILDGLVISSKRSVGAGCPYFIPRISISLIVIMSPTFIFAIFPQLLGGPNLRLFRTTFCPILKVISAPKLSMNGHYLLNALYAIGRYVRPLVNCLL